MKISHILLATALSASLGFAHQIVTNKVQDHFELGFWVHDGFDKYEKSQIMGVKAYDKNAKPIDTGVDYSKDPAQILTGNEPAMIVSVFDAKYWTKTDKGYTNKPLHEINGVAFDSMRSIKLGKTFFDYSSSLSNPVGLELEVTPLINPLTLKVGDTLPVLVTYQGKALEGASFESKTHDLEAKSNKFGVAFIPIKENGLQIIAAVYKYPYIFDNQAQTMNLQSSISFNIK